MKQESLDAMSVKDLTELSARVQARIAKARTEQAAMLRTRIETMVTQAGMSVSEVLGKLRPGPATARTSKVAPKYRDPATGTTWTGRGRTPRWMPKRKSDWNSVAL